MLPKSDCCFAAGAVPKSDEEVLVVLPNREVAGAVLDDAPNSVVDVVVEVDAPKSGADEADVSDLSAADVNAKEEKAALKELMEGLATLEVVDLANKGVGVVVDVVGTGAPDDVLEQSVSPSEVEADLNSD